MPRLNRLQNIRHDLRLRLRGAQAEPGIFGGGDKPLGLTNQDLPPVSNASIL
jgi:hypothetical protein